MPLFDDTRSDWNARAPRNGGFPYVAPSRRTGRMWHWNGPAVHLIGKPHSACLAAVLGDQRYHQDHNGWRDIGYQALVCPHGRAIEGAGVDKIAAHCKGYNTSHYGIQLMVGEGESTPPAACTPAPSDSPPTSQARSGHTLGDLGHRQGFATTCPGDEIYAWVRAGGPRRRPGRFRRRLHHLAHQWRGIHQHPAGGRHDDLRTSRTSPTRSSTATTSPPPCSARATPPSPPAARSSSSWSGP